MDDGGKVVQDLRVILNIPPGFHSQGPAVKKERYSIPLTDKADLQCFKH